MKFIYLVALSLFTASAFSQTWEDVASLPSSASIRHHPITFSINGVGYLMGGATPTSGVLKDFFSYDPDADEWTEKTEFPGTARGFAYGVSSGTKGYIGFGLYEDGGSSFTVLNDLWEYDPETDAWTELAPFPGTARFHPAMVYRNNKIFVGIGGSEFGDLGDWWEYDIATDTWTEKSTFPGTNRHHPYYFGIGDYVYVGFGHHLSDIYNDFYRYDPSDDTWTTLNNFPAQGRVAGTQFSYFGKGYVLSGQGETHTNLPTGEFWEYTPETDSWTALTAHPSGGRWAPGSFRIDNKIFFTCGEANTGEKRDMMVYEFETFASIEDVSTTAISLIPNPATTGLVTVKNNIDYKTATIFNSAGQQVLSAKIDLNNAIDVTALKTGMYFVQFQNAKKTVTEKLIIE